MIDGSGIGRKLLLLGLSIAGGVFLGALGLVFLEKHYIYLARPYTGEELSELRKGVEELNFVSSQGQQVAFYVPAQGKEDQVPRKLWIAFHGQGSLALHWLWLIRSYAEEDAAFLLIDYPGYGKCEGTSSPTSILENAQKALQELKKLFETTGQKNSAGTSIPESLAAIGHSLGSGPALLFASKEKIQKTVLFSPFSSLFDMVCHRIGRPLCYLLRHDFDNRARLQELAEQKPLPQVIIVHGAKDEIIPVKQSRALKKRFPKLIDYIEVPEGIHDMRSLIHYSGSKIFAKMRG